MVIKNIRLILENIFNIVKDGNVGLYVDHKKFTVTQRVTSNLLKIFGKYSTDRVSYISISIEEKNKSSNRIEFKENLFEGIGYFENLSIKYEDIREVVKKGKNGVKILLKENTAITDDNKNCLYDRNEFINLIKILADIDYENTEDDSMETKNNEYGQYSMNEVEEKTKYSIGERYFGRKIEKNIWDEYIGKIENGESVENFKCSVIENNNAIKFSKRIELYEKLDITLKDKLSVNFNEDIKFERTVLLLNSSNKYVTKFTINEYVETEFDDKENEVPSRKFYLEMNADDLCFENQGKCVLLFCEDTVKNNFIKYYQIPVEVEFRSLETTDKYLCIDFGTSNTTAGAYLDSNYVSNVSNIAQINGNIKLDAENLVSFLDCENEMRIAKLNTIVPTAVYVLDCSNKEDIKYIFGYEATEKIKEDGFCPKASCFMEIKRWTSDVEKKEKLDDGINPLIEISRKEIIEKYLMFIIKNAENQFKCKFKNVHITAPVKLKNQVLDIYGEILEKNGYVLEKDNAIDEGVAVLYNSIKNEINRAIENKESTTSQKSLIIDCGGGTSDLASCTFKINLDYDRDVIDVPITTEYMNGDVNFGGNNLTYRIMQYMKILYAAQLDNASDNLKVLKRNKRNKDNLMKNIIPYDDAESILIHIEDEDDASDDVVKERVKEIYKNLESLYDEAEKLIPTKFKNYENDTESYSKVKNNFYFLWKLADNMKKEFYKTSSITHYSFDLKKNDDALVKVEKVKEWKISYKKENQFEPLKNPPEIAFSYKDIDLLLQADIYYLVRRFLNDLFESGELNTYDRVKLSGQSSKINIFMDSLKMFLPGKKVKSGNSKRTNVEELKLLCLKGSIAYINDLKSSDIHPHLSNSIRKIPCDAFIQGKLNSRTLFKQGDDWNQAAEVREVTDIWQATEIHLLDKNKSSELQPKKYEKTAFEYKEISFEELLKISNGRISDSVIKEKIRTFNTPYIVVYLDEKKWGFHAILLKKDDNGTLFYGNHKFFSFEMDCDQIQFFDGTK